MKFLQDQFGEPCAEGGAVLLRNENWGYYYPKDCMIFYSRSRDQPSRSAALLPYSRLPSIVDALIFCFEGNDAKPAPVNLLEYAGCIVETAKPKPLGAVVAALAVRSLAAPSSEGSSLLSNAAYPDGGLFVDQRTVMVIGGPSAVQLRVSIVVSPNFLN